MPTTLEGRKCGYTEVRKYEYYVPSLFFEKAENMHGASSK